MFRKSSVRSPAVWVAKEFLLQSWLSIQTLFSVCLFITLPQQHVKYPSHSGKNAAGKLQLYVIHNVYTLTMSTWLLCITKLVINAEEQNLQQLLNITLRLVEPIIVIIIMYIYHALINVLCAYMIHINLNMIFYTPVAHSPTKRKNKHTHHTHTHTHTHTQTVAETRYQYFWLRQNKTLSHLPATMPLIWETTTNHR